MLPSTRTASAALLESESRITAWGDPARAATADAAVRRTALAGGVGGVPSRVLVVVSLLLVLTGCNTGEAATGGPSPTPSSPSSTPAACKSAQTEGVLVALGTEVLGITPRDGRVLRLIWPSGYTVTRGTVFDDQGHAIAQAGDLVQVDGGEAKAGWWEVCAGSLVLLPA